MDVVRALVGIHNFQIDHVADHAEIVRNVIRAQHVTCGACEVINEVPGPDKLIGA